MKVYFTKSLLRFSAVMLLLMAFSFSSIAQGTFVSRTTGNWNTNTSWTLSSGTDADGIPDADDIVTVRPGNTISLTGAQACSSLTVGDGSTNSTAKLDVAAQTLTVSGNVSILASNGQRVGNLSISTGTVNIGGNLTSSAVSNAQIVFTGAGVINMTGATSAWSYSSASTFTAFNSTVSFVGATSSITTTTGFNNITIKTGSTTTSSAAFTASLFTIEANAKFIQQVATGVVPGTTKSFAATSTYEWRGTGTFPSVSGITFGNLIINSPSGNNSANGNLTSVLGNLTITNTTGGSYSLASTTSPTVSIAGNLQIDGGLLNFSSGSGAPTVNVGGNVILNGGTLQPSTSTGLPLFFISGNWTNNGATFTPGTGTVTFTGSAANQTITKASGETFSNLTINKGSGVVTMANNVTVNNALVLNTNGVLGVSTNTLTLNGSLTRTLGTISTISGTVIFNGSAAQAVPIGVFTSDTIAKLKIFNINGVTLNSNVIIKDSLVVDGLFKPVPAAFITSGTGAKTLTGSGTIQVTVDTGRNNLSTQYALNRILTNLTTEYIGTATQSADGTTYGILKISNNNGAALNGSATATSLNLNSGILSIGNNTLTVNGAVNRTTGTLAGSISSSLTLAGAAGTLFFDNTGTNNYLKVLTINSGASATLGNALNIADYDGTVAEGRLSVIGSGILNTGGFLTLKSTANGTARVAPGNAAGGYVNGAVTVERYIPQNPTKAWRLLASNTIGQTINQAWQEGQANSASNTNPGFGTMIAGKFATIPLAQAAGFDTISPAPSLYKYDGATDSLTAVANTNSTQLSSEQGYFLYLRGDRSPGQFGSNILATTHTTLRSKGTLFQGNQPVINIPADQFILLRNPYASAIDVRFITISGGVDSSFQIWDPNLAGGYNLGGFQTIFYDGSEYVIAPGGGSYPSAGPYTLIESGSAFFMQSVGSAGTVQIRENCKTQGSKVVMRPVGTTGILPKISTKLYYVSGGNLSLADGNVVIFDNAFSNDVSNEDVKKNTNFGEDLAIAKAGYNLVVDKRPIPSTEDSVVFNVQALKRSNYRLEVNSTAPVPGMYATLEDKFTNSSVLLNLTGVTTYDFSVTANTASSAANRFQIKFTPAVVLPIVFTSIKAAQVNKEISVEWKVTNQAGIAKYEIEKSSDGRSFAIAGSQAIQNGAGELTYNWLDKAPQQGVNYYRIKSIDATGKVAYTSIAKVVLNQKGTGFGLYPNPIRSKEALSIQLINQPAGTYNIRLVNPTGQELYRQVLKHAGGSASQNINTPASLAKGVYQVQVISKEKMVSTQQLIIEN